MKLYIDSIKSDLLEELDIENNIDFNSILKIDKIDDEFKDVIVESYEIFKDN